MVSRLASTFLLLMVSAMVGHSLPSRDSEAEGQIMTMDGEKVDEASLLEALRFLVSYRKLLSDFYASEQLREGAKRSLDFGLGRGFSGSLAAKHLLGWNAANYAGGPGRKRRSVAHSGME